MTLQDEIIYDELKFYFDRLGIDTDGDLVGINGNPIFINLKMIAADANNETHSNNSNGISVTNINEAKLLLMYLKTQTDFTITRTPITKIEDVIHHEINH